MSLQESSPFRTQMLTELRRQLRKDRAPGESARGSVAKAKKIVALRYGMPGQVDFVRNIEAECVATCRTDKYIKVHASRCIAHRLDRARAEVERKERMCKKHGVPDRLDCGRCFPQPLHSKPLSRGW